MGPGRCQRRVLELLERATGHALDREELDAVLCDREGYDRSNVLRAIRSLERRRLVRFKDAHQKRDATVKLAPPPTPVSDEELTALLALFGIGNGGQSGHREGTGTAPPPRGPRPSDPHRSGAAGKGGAKVG